MTTIAYRDGILAADTLITSAGIVDGYAQKIARNAVGDLAGGSGNNAVCRAFMAWFAGGEEGDPPEWGEDIGNGLIVRCDGCIELFMQHGRSAIRADFYAIGSGYQIALGAMAMGASAVDAVTAAIKLDTASGGDITVLRHKGD